MAKRISFVLLLLILFAVPSFAETLPLLTKKYERAAGKPDVFTENISVCNTGATYNLVVQNGEGGKNRISSASVVINGMELIKENEFNQQVDKIEKTVSLLPENIIEVKLKSIPGSFITVNIQCTANCLDAAITTPVDGSAINKSKILVKGSLYNAYGETGVTIGNAPVTPSPLVGEGRGEGELNSVRVLAHSDGNNFAGIVPLQAGVNTLTVTATDACGQKAEDTVTVNAVPAAETIRLSVNPSSGVISPETGMLNVKFEVDVYGTALNYAWDFDGDGVIDRQGADIPSVTFGYSQSGLYFPMVAVIDSNGNSYSETAVVSVMSLAEVDAILKGKWDGMKGSLSAGNAEKALSYIAPKAQPRYKTIFSLLGQKMPAITATQKDLIFLYLSEGRAKYKLLMQEGGKTYAFEVVFVQDKDGIWRVLEF